MVSFRDAVPPTNPADVAVLAQQMKLNRPVSLRNLIGDLNAPTAVVFSSGTLKVSNATASASATWTLNAQGFWNFTGSINNSSYLGQNYAVGMALNVKDANGNFLGVVHSDSVGPGLPGFNNNASWNDTGFDQRIIDHWPAIFGARSSAHVTVTTDPVHILEGILEGILGLTVAGVLIAAAILLGPGGGKWNCDPTPSISVSGDNSGIGADATWTCQQE